MTMTSPQVFSQNDAKCWMGRQCTFLTKEFSLFFNLTFRIPRKEVNYPGKHVQITLINQERNQNQNVQSTFKFICIIFLTSQSILFLVSIFNQQQFHTVSVVLKRVLEVHSLYSDLQTSLSCKKQWFLLK